VVDSNDANGLSWLLTNHQGSPTDTLDPVSGYPLTDMRFTAWGQTRLTSGPVDEDRMPTQQRYTGQYQDDDIPDLYFYNARWYDAQPGRFLQADTLVPGMDGLAWDRYAYARNSPVVYSDPSGHKACELVCQSDYVDWNHAITGLDSDSWDHTLQKQRTEILDRFLTKFTTIGVSVLFEPADWAITGYECANGNCSPAALLGLLPFIPATAGNNADEILVAVDDVYDLASGQVHHVFSNRIWRRMQKYPALSNLISDRNQMLVLARDSFSHSGYQAWHRAYDSEIVQWLIDHPGKSLSWSRSSTRYASR